MTNPYRIKLMTWSEARPLARSVRERVFIEEQGVPRELEWDEWDEPSDHAVAFDARASAIGTARLLPDGHVERLTTQVCHALLPVETYADEFHQAGLRIEGIYGDFDQSSYTENSPNLILLAQAEGG